MFHRFAAHGMRRRTQLLTQTILQRFPNSGLPVDQHAIAVAELGGSATALHGNTDELIENGFCRHRRMGGGMHSMA